MLDLNSRVRHYALGMRTVIWPDGSGMPDEEFDKLAPIIRRLLGA